LFEDTPMIIATCDPDQTVVIGDPMADMRARAAAENSASPDPGPGSLGDGGGAAVPSKASQPIPSPLNEEELEEFSRIKCYVCGETISPEDITSHSKVCVLEAAPNLRLTLDKWCIASSNMTLAEQRAFVQMRRTEELERVEKLEENLTRQMTQLWWMGGRFGYIVSSKWLREWRGFVGVGRQVSVTKDRPPPPINNNDLFELAGSLRVGLREGIQYDYHVLEQPIWELYFQIYGGGPTIIRYNSSRDAMLPALSDHSVTFDGDWRDRRPDTGRGHVFDPYSGVGFDGEIRRGFLWSCTGKGLLRNGSHFEGQVVRGVPDGNGREVRPDGSVLEGCFRGGKLRGFGRHIDPQGRALEGEWEDGELLGI